MSMATMTKATSTPAGAALHGLIQRLVSRRDRLFGVVDAARDNDLAMAAPKQYGQTITWLFEPGSAAHMRDVAPYLVPIAYEPKYPYAGSGYLDLWAQKLGGSAGILLVTSADQETLLAHLRTLFHIRGPDDHRYYFRFYDPRVLRVYLPTCTGAEATEFFGPMRRILVEAEPRPSGSGLLLCSAGPQGSVIEEQPLGGSSAGGRR